MIQIILCLCAALIFFLQNLNYWKMDNTFLKMLLKLPHHNNSTQFLITSQSKNSKYSNWKRDL